MATRCSPRLVTRGEHQVAGIPSETVAPRVEAPWGARGRLEPEEHRPPTQDARYGDAREPVGRGAALQRQPAAPRLWKGESPAVARTPRGSAAAGAALFSAGRNRSAG